MNIHVAVLTIAVVVTTTCAVTPRGGRRTAPHTTNTPGITAPLVFHAGCNMLMYLLEAHYFGG